MGETAGSAAAIWTRGLRKTYRAKEKGEGLAESVRALARPRWREVEAVRGVDLEVGRGEIVAFIGPNGAGKSTFIKMLCGILQPSGGEISVLGLSPARDRRRLAMRIGAVFGQKSQLWMHLPALDSFTLLGAIYEISDADRRRRVSELSELFGLGEFLKTPVRKLSLGQRVRCEVAASLLHEPELLFLDEPTIGLDVVVKRAIREFVARNSRERGTTVFLTSHDPADVEQLCRRAVVIDRGAVALDLPVEKMRGEYLGKKLIEVSFASPQDLRSMDGVAVERKDGGMRATLTVDTGGSGGADGAGGAVGMGGAGDADGAASKMAMVMERLSATGAVLDITISNPPMEDIIAEIFRRSAAASCGEARKESGE